MFLNFRTRRSGANKEKSKSIFRGKARKSKDESPPPPRVNQVLTMTLSEDSGDSYGEVRPICNDRSHVVSYTEQSHTTVSFTEQEVLENALKQMRQQQEIHQKQHEIIAHKQKLANLNRQLAEKSHLLLELKRTHSLKMTAKQQEISKMRNVLSELKQTYEEKLATKQKELNNVKTKSEQQLAEKQNELTEVKTELKDRKQELSKVGSTLIQCQHELHEQQENKTFFWF
jgi:chromosome segregation ATPase